MPSIQSASGPDEYRERYIQLLHQYQELLNLYEVLDQIVEHSADAIWVSDIEGNCIRINKAYEALIGMSREEMIGRNAQSLVGDVVSAVCSLDVLKTGKTLSFEQKFYLTGRSALVTGTPVFDNSGRVIMCVCNDRDMHSLEELSRQLQQTQQDIEKYRMEIEAMRTHFSLHSNIVVEDKGMLETLHRASRVAKLDSSVLILGETGVGKEEIAKFIHENSPRAKESFVKVDCGAMVPSLIESELFGYVKGAYTSASNSGKMGLFEIANKGTIFLDEIGDLPIDVQVKLLRVIQEQELKRVGDTKEIKIDVRIVSATNRDLRHMVEEKTFRSDLYYRINVYPLHIPPLRERINDIVPLAMHFLRNLNQKYQTNKTFHYRVERALREYYWPGNVRELKNCIEQAYVSSEADLIHANHLPFWEESTEDSRQRLPVTGDEPLQDALERVEYSYIHEAYEHYQNVRDAAKSLQMSPATFVRKRKYYEGKKG